MFLGVSSSRMKKKKVCVKRKKKKKERCRNGLGYCPTVSQYNEKLYCDTAGLKGVQGLAAGGRSRYSWLYRDSSTGLAGGELCHNTRNCIVTSGLLAGKKICVAIHQIVL